VAVVGPDPAPTVRAAVAVVTPVALLAVKVYVVEVAGATERLPAGATAPIPWSMVTDVASNVVHDSVVVAPAAIVAGLTVNVTGGGGGLIVNKAAAVVVPLAFVAETV
jgi:hypothetical protein